MELKGNLTDKIPIKNLWDIISNANEFVKCLPNVNSVDVNGDSFNLRFNVNIKEYTKSFLGSSYLSNLNVKFSGQIKNKEEMKHVEIYGEGSSMGMKFELKLVINLESNNDNTSMNWVADVDMGKITKLFGENIINEASSSVVNQIIECVKYRAKASSN